MSELRTALQRLATRAPEVFHALFWKGVTVDSEVQERELWAFGLLEESGGGVRGKVQVWSDGEVFIVTDRPDYPLLDRVFPIFSDESLFLWRCASHAAPGRVLDVGTGSGVLAVLAARNGGNVVGIDTNARALTFARLNAALNGVANRVKLVRGDALGAVGSRAQFDFIIANPPFVPVPPRCPFHVAGGGGIDGVDVIRKILARGSGALSSDGVLFMSAVSLEREGLPYVVELATQMLPPEMKIMSIPIYDRRASLDEFCAVFKPWDVGSVWAKHLERRGFDSVGYFVLVAAAAEVLEQFRGVAVSPPDETKFSGSWERRFARYKYWLARTRV